MILSLLLVISAQDSQPVNDTYARIRAYRTCVDGEVVRRAKGTEKNPEAIAQDSITACDQLADAAYWNSLLVRSDLAPGPSRAEFVDKYRAAAQRLADKTLKESVE